MKYTFSRAAALLALWGMVAPVSHASSIRQLAEITFLNPKIDGVTQSYSSNILSTGEIVAVPEPQTWATLLGGLGTLGLLQRMRLRKN